jgi:hypothetical protein
MCDRPAMSVTALLLGCVATKRANRAPAKDLYCSPLWVRRGGIVCRAVPAGVKRSVLFAASYNV